jgi:hypothetical protein
MLLHLPLLRTLPARAPLPNAPAHLRRPLSHLTQFAVAEYVRDFVWGEDQYKQLYGDKPPATDRGKAHVSPARRRTHTEGRGSRSEHKNHTRDTD